MVGLEAGSGEIAAVAAAATGGGKMGSVEVEVGLMRIVT